MPTNIVIWDVTTGHAKEVSAGKYLENELERWILTERDILGEHLLVVGEQKRLKGAGRFDLLALDEHGRVVVIELKRKLLPRDVIAQALDYASWVNSATADEIRAIADQYLEMPLQEAYSDEFDSELDLNPKNHRVMIVGTALDDVAERIVTYLAEYSTIPFNAVFFRYGELSKGQRVLVRTVLVPEREADTEPPIPMSEVEKLAQERGVLKLVRVFRTLEDGEYAAPRATRRFGGASIRFRAKDPQGKSRVIFGLAVTDKRFKVANGELAVWLRLGNLARVSAKTENYVRHTLEKQLRFEADGRRSYVLTRVKTEAQAKKFITQYKKWIDAR